MKTAGGQQIFGTPATEAEAAAIIKACDEAGIYYGSAYTAPPFYTPADARALGPVRHARLGEDRRGDRHGAVRGRRR